ncbi:hypothetical protein DPMN_127281 [Dreissena polymorpha]|uniref:Uncharacterized protein n=1 Tax=Dreissena polymorpha TaxID=45954 RepID=A0A9D4GXD5_DREPO|nr:hypothetical protein DPMN_127281 [Dreissena polymorpha]
MARQRPTRLVMWPCIVEIDRIVIREVQYQLEVNRLKGHCGWVWPMWAGHPRVGNGAMHMNRCRNEEFIVKDNFVWVWPIWAGRHRIDPIVIREVQYQLEVNQSRNEEVIVGRFRVGNGAMHIEIDRIVIREFQYQFEVNRCRNEEIIVQGNCGWVWSMWAGHPRIDRIVIKEVQYQFEVNRCINEEVNFQGSSAYSVGGDSGQDGWTDRRTDRRRI